MTFQEKNRTQIEWLMEGDAPIRYQTMKDLLEDPPLRAEEERHTILKEGWGKALMERQAADGSWGGGLYSPKWISTFYTLLLLFRFEAPADSRLKKAAQLLLDRGFYEKDGGINYWKTWKQGETCVTGMLLSMVSHFDLSDDRIPLMVRFLKEQQMTDGGWNCERYRGATHSSFHTTISVLEGLHEYGKICSDPSGSDEAEELQEKGREFLFAHRLYKSSTTGETVHPDMALLSFPPRWHYDYIRALDYFQSSAVPYDRRMDDALNLLKSRQRADGFWKLEKQYGGKLFFKLEKGGQPSRWNTLRALRIFKWLGNQRSFIS